MKNLKTAWAASRGALRDLAFLVGIGAADYGIWLLSEPVAIICGGLALSAIAYLGAEPDANDEPNQ